MPIERPDLAARNRARGKGHRRDAHGKKECVTCRSWQDEENFFAHGTTVDRLSPRCRACANEYQKVWARENRSRVRDNQRKIKYGITPQEWDAMFESQGRACAICKVDEPGKGSKGQWNTDHNHLTGKVRGILCWPCNTAIGKFKDNPATLRRAADYLEEES